MKLPAQATIEHAAGLAESLPAALAAGSGVVQIDASELVDLDTSTLALLLQARRLVQAQGRDFRVVGAPKLLFDLAKLYGVEDLLVLTPRDARAAPDAAVNPEQHPGASAAPAPTDASRPVI